MKTLRVRCGRCGELVASAEYAPAERGLPDGSLCVGARVRLLSPGNNDREARRWTYGDALHRPYEADPPSGTSSIRDIALSTLWDPRRNDDECPSFLDAEHRSNTSDDEDDGWWPWPRPAPRVPTSDDAPSVGFDCPHCSYECRLAASHIGDALTRFDKTGKTQTVRTDAGTAVRSPRARARDNRWATPPRFTS